MILYHPKLGTELSEYGIELPLRDDRSLKVFELLKEEFPSLEMANLGEIKLLTLGELKECHESGFLEKLSKDESFLIEMLKTYECGDEASQKEGHHPTKATKPIHQLRESILWQVSATYHALQMALKENFCFFLGGGMHHAHAGHGSGFCPLNDIVISLRLAQKSDKIKKALVIDTDAHFGDGTAQMTENDESIKTMSIHMDKGWPFKVANEKQAPCSNVDIGISSGQEAQYLTKLSGGLEQFAHESFDCAIIVAGADPHCDDELLSTQSLRLSSAQMLARDMLVYKWCLERKIPQLWLMAGGYGEGAPKVYAQFILKILHLMR